MTKIFLFLIVLILFNTCIRKPEKSVTDYVDPFIGTGGHGHTYPGPAFPFGQVQPGPDNGQSGWDWCSGYHDSDTLIAGFSNTHLSGTGCPDLSDILFIPVTREYDPCAFDFNSKVAYNLRASFKKKDETASLGYYSVILDNGVKVELSASKRVAYQRYTYPEKQLRSVVIDLGYSANDEATLKTSINKINATTLSGLRLSTGWAKNHQVYFVSNFSDTIDHIKYFSDNDSNKLKIQLFFAKKNEPLIAKIALSSVDTKGAFNNLNTDKPGFDFDMIRRLSIESWGKELNKIHIYTTDEKLKRIFYTALYHTFLEPSVFSDYDGRYKGFKNPSKQTEKYNQYTVLSLWDTFRALNPLFNITQPEVANDLIKSMLAKYKETDTLPIWELMGNETYTMPGFHAVAVINDAIMKGQGDFDKELAYKAMKDFAMSNYEGLDYFKKIGYVPADKINQSASKTLEYSYNFWCIAKTAEYLGKTADSKYFYKLASNYKNIFDVKTKFMRGKNLDGRWKEPFDPRFSNHQKDPFTEGNSWQWTWFVPHDVNGLCNFFSNKQNLIAKLDSLFTADSNIKGEQASADISGLIGQYAHGNEPSHGTAFIYEVLDEKPWRTQEIVDEILHNLYTDKRDGLCGNEDCGQMSAWYVFNSIGFYPFCPGDNKYYFSRPMFDKVIIELPNGNKFKVIAHNNNILNKYIASVSLNGSKLDRHFINHDEIMNGGELVFEMSGTVNSVQ